MTESTHTSSSEIESGTPELLQRLRETRRPEALSVDGQGEVVVQDAEAYQDLLNRLDHAEAIVGIHRGLESMRRGEGIPAEEAIDRLRTELGVGTAVK
ncbi:MAG TPA: hypothetical protein VGB92_15960 [Longimicrobium sp.]|jgi:hypothetical protein